MRDIEEIRRVSKIYDDRAQVTDSIKAAGQWGNKELVNEITQEIIKKMDIKSEDIILEIGCGSGVLGNVVEENCKSYYGFDASKFMLKKFESEYDTNYTYNLIQASATEIPFKDEHGKTGADYLRDSIVEATIKRHPLACREEILQAMDDMGF